jgi:hypothetical protein
MIRALGPSQAQAVDGQRRRLPGIHLIVSTPAIEAGVGCGFDRRHLVHGRRRCGLGLRGKVCAPLAPPEQTHDPIAQDVHCLVQCPAAPCMWVQHHNGIFVSSDEASFNEIADVEPSTFGFPVVVHPREPDTAWFVPDQDSASPRRTAGRDPYAQQRQSSTC